VGKSTLRQGVLSRLASLEYSVSHTTREPRPGEKQGVDYHFVTPEVFRAMVADEAFVEWARVHQHYYGTSRAELDKRLQSCQDVILEIDVQGARQIKAHYPTACFIFVLPPDAGSLKARLQRRRTEDAASLETRLTQAAVEIAEAPWYDYLLVNDTLEEATDMLAAIIVAERCRTKKVASRVLALYRTLGPQKNAADDPSSPP